MQDVKNPTRILLLLLLSLPLENTASDLTAAKTKPCVVCHGNKRTRNAEFAAFPGRKRGRPSAAMHQADKEGQGAEGKETGDHRFNQEGCPAAQEKDMNKRPGKTRGRERLVRKCQGIVSMKRFLLLHQLGILRSRETMVTCSVWRTWNTV